MKLISTYIALLFLITHHCFSDVFDTIQGANNVRAGKYNAPLNSVLDLNDPMDLSKLSAETTKINSLLTKNVSTTVYATTEQKKKALQAVFSAEIIYGDSRPSYLDGVSESDAKYKHCYILEQSKLFARDFLGQICVGEEVVMNAPYYSDLCIYSGLMLEDLVGWLLEMFDKHAIGFNARQERSEFYAATGYYTSKAHSLFDYNTSKPVEREIYSQKSEEQINQYTQMTMEQLLQFVVGLPREQFENIAEELHKMGPLADEIISQVLRSIPVMEGQSGEVTDKVVREVRALMKTMASNLASSKSVAPTASPSAVPFKGNWTESFKLKNGETITHTPNNVSMGGMSAGKELHMSSRNLKIHVLTDSTREEFVAALKRDGNL